MAINNLPRASSPNSGDLLPIFSALLGADAVVTLQALAAYLQTMLTGSGAMATQYAAPSATGFSVTIAPVTAGGNVWLLLTPTGAFAAGTITLPASPVDAQEVLVSCTQAVTALTVAGNGSTVTGAPTTLAANAAFRLRFDGVTRGWFRAV